MLLRHFGTSALRHFGTDLVGDVPIPSGNFGRRTPCRGFTSRAPRPTPVTPYARRMDFLLWGIALCVFFGGISVIGALRRIAAATEEIARNTRAQAEVDAPQ